MFCKKATKKSCGKMVRKQPARHSRPDSWNVNISFNLGQSQSNNSMANFKIKYLDVTLDDSADFIDKS